MAAPPSNSPAVANRPGEQPLIITPGSVLVLVLAVPLLVLLWQLRSLILLVLISVVLASAIAPVVDWAERYRLPRWLAVVLIYLTILATIVGAGVLAGPTVFEQIQLLIGQVPVALKNVYDVISLWALNLNNTRPELANDLVNRVLDIQGLSSWVIRSSQQLLVRSYGVTAGILGGVFSLILSLFLSGYMVADSRTLINNLVRLLPRPWDERLAAQVGPMSNRIGSYIRGRLLVSFTLALATTIGLSVLGLSDFALGLGTIAGVTNLIPFLGPILGAIPALVVAVPQGGWVFLWVLLLYVVIQNIETYILDPLLVGSSVGVHPLYQLLAVLGGTQVLGIIGALIVPPWVAGGAVLLENLYLRPKLIRERRRFTAPAAPEPVAPAESPPAESIITSPY